MPFVTEEIWDALGDVAPDRTAGEPLLIRAAWPAPGPRDPEAERDFDAIATLVRGVRNLRTEAGTPAGAWVALRIDPTDADAVSRLAAARPYVEALARVRPIDVAGGAARPSLVTAGPLGAAWLEAQAAPDEGSTERRRAQIEEVERNVDRLRALLANEAFTSKAPAAVVDRERERLSALERELEQLRGD
jgi:valyl-tRNA synthetase